MGTLFVVGTPIGNLEDVSARALRVLGEVSAIAAEDTRVTRKLLARHGITTRVTSCHEHTSPRRLEALVRRLDDGDVALVTDAGTPGVSDPGAELVAAAVAAGHTVVAVPGPSAVTAALSVAGLAGDSHTFLGFLPRQRADRRRLLTDARAHARTLVLFEAPHRLAASLRDMAEVLGADRRVCVARELTKLHEETWHGSLADAADRWADVRPRGEFVLVVDAGDAPVAPVEDWSDERVREAVAELRAGGLGARDAARRVAARAGRSARDVYALAHVDAEAVHRGTTTRETS